MDQLKNIPLSPAARIIVDVHLSSNSPLHLAQRDSSPRASVSIEKATSTCKRVQQWFPTFACCLLMDNIALSSCSKTCLLQLGSLVVAADEVGGAAVPPLNECPVCCQHDAAFCFSTIHQCPGGDRKDGRSGQDG
jgi:hypothetical protein